MPAATRCIRACYLDTINASLPRDQTPIIELYSVRRTWCTATRCISACNLNTIGASLPRDQTPLAGVLFIVCSLYSITCESLICSVMQCYQMHHCHLHISQHHRCITIIAWLHHHFMIRRFISMWCDYFLISRQLHRRITSTGADAPKLEYFFEYFLAMAESYLKNLGTRRNKFLSPTPSSLFSMSYVQSHYQMPCVCNHDTISASIVHHLPIYPLLSVAVELWCVGRIWCMC